MQLECCGLLAEAKGLLESYVSTAVFLSVMFLLNEFLINSSALSASLFLFV